MMITLLRDQGWSTKCGVGMVRSGRKRSSRKKLYEPKAHFLDNEKRKHLIVLLRDASLLSQELDLSSVHESMELAILLMEWGDEITTENI